MLEETGGATAAGNRYRYSGYQHDGESGLYYLNARYYSAKLARFMTQDTYTGKTSDPLSLNLYTYSFNNPLRYYDPTGRIVTAWDWTTRYKSSRESFAQNVSKSAAEQGMYVDPETAALAFDFGTGYVLGELFAGAKLGAAAAEAGNAAKASNAANAGNAAKAAQNSWYKADGTLNPPPNNGAVKGTEQVIELQPGAKLGRFGTYGKTSDFVTAPGSAQETFSLPPYTDVSIYQDFTVLKPIPGVTKATVAPWGGSAGGGTQHKTADANKKNAG